MKHEFQKATEFLRVKLIALEQGIWNVLEEGGENHYFPKKWAVDYINERHTMIGAFRRNFEMEQSKLERMPEETLKEQYRKLSAIREPGVTAPTAFGLSLMIGWVTGMAVMSATGSDWGLAASVVWLGFAARSMMRDNREFKAFEEKCAVIKNETYKLMEPHPA